MTDASTGVLIYMQARYYDPGVVRFVSEDPTGSGLNWYVYCSDSPVDLSDPTGKDGELADTLESMGDAMGIDASLDGLGLNELTEAPWGVNSDNDLSIYIENIQSQGKGLFDKSKFTDVLNYMADEWEVKGVRIAGQCNVGSDGYKMFEAFQAILGDLGDAGQLTHDGDAATLYWETQS